VTVLKTIDTIIATRCIDGGYELLHTTTGTSIRLCRISVYASWSDTPPAQRREQVRKELAAHYAGYANSYRARS
jgi:hypothetical protein